VRPDGGAVDGEGGVLHGAVEFCADLDRGAGYGLDAAAGDDYAFGGAAGVGGEFVSDMEFFDGWAGDDLHFEIAAEGAAAADAVCESLADGGEGEAEFFGKISRRRLDLGHAFDRLGGAFDPTSEFDAPVAASAGFDFDGQGAALRDGDVARGDGEGVRVGVAGFEEGGEGAGEELARGAGPDEEGGGDGGAGEAGGEHGAARAAGRELALRAHVAGIERRGFDDLGEHLLRAAQAVRAIGS